MVIPPASSRESPCFTYCTAHPAASPHVATNFLAYTQVLLHEARVHRLQHIGQDEGGLLLKDEGAQLALQDAVTVRGARCTDVKPSVHLGCTDSKDGEAKGLMRGEDYAPRALGRKPYRSWLRLSPRSRVCLCVSVAIWRWNALIMRAKCSLRAYPWTRPDRATVLSIKWLTCRPRTRSGYVKSRRRPRLRPPARS